MKVLVAGSRTVNNQILVSSVIEAFLKNYNITITELVSGKARGVDTLAENWANNNGILVKPFPAKWDDLKAPGAIIRLNKYGKPYNVKAGFDRNLLMAQYADVLIAIRDGKSKGTKDMMDQAKAHAAKVFVYRTDQ